MKREPNRLHASALPPQENDKEDQDRKFLCETAREPVSDVIWGEVDWNNEEISCRDYQRRKADQHHQPKVFESPPA